MSVTCYTLYQSNLSFNPPPPPPPPHQQGIPQAFDTFAVQGGGNLIISQPFQLLASQLVK